MKKRKFMKKLLSVKYIVAILIVLCLGVVATVYFTVGIDAKTLGDYNNLEYNTEGFTDYNGKIEPVYKKNTTKTWWIGDADTKISDSQAKFTEKNGTWHFSNINTEKVVKDGDYTEYNNETKTWWILNTDATQKGTDLEIEYKNVVFEATVSGNKTYWYITDLDSEIKTDMSAAKIVGENNDYVMFLDEITTIVTVCTKKSQLKGTDGTHPDDYTIKYQSARTDGADEKKANLTIHYESTNLANLNKGDMDVFKGSVSYYNELTGASDKHYEIRTEKNKVMIYYTVGNFSTPTAYFPEYIYATRYEPAECLYYDEDGNFLKKEYNEAVENYEKYLETVGSIYNTFEERFRGSVQIMDRTKLVGDVHLLYRTGEITVYSQKALEYLLDTVFPYLEEQGINVPDYDKEELFEKARKSANRSGNKETVEWTLDKIPDELTDPNGEYYNMFFNVEGSPLTNNPFIINTTYQNELISYYKEQRANANYSYAFFQSSISGGVSAMTVYKYFYGEDQSVYKDKGIEYPIVEEINGEYVPFVNSGFVKRDENGTAVRDESGKLVKELYSLDLVKKDNSLFGSNDGGVAIFKIAIQFELTDNGLQVTIPREYIVDSSNVTKKLSKDDDMYSKIKGDYVITTANICPYITEVDDSQSGYMIIPDGSGAVINFNNNKTGTVSATYYGQDMTYISPMKQEEKAQLLLGMYAFVTTTRGNKKGIIAAINQGGGQLALTAGVNSNSKTNFAYMTATLRSTETTYTGTVSEPKTFLKLDKTLSPLDIVLDYILLNENELEYGDIAKKYQDYLVNRYDGLKAGNDTTDTNVTDLTFLGTFEKYSLFLGIKYMTEDSLTTFDQAKNIINELEDQNVNNINVSYKSWTSENLEYEVGGSLKVSKVLGKTSTMQSFYKFCASKNINFYPEIYITTAKGYNYMLGSTRYSARGVGNTEAVEYQYDLATGRPDKTLNEKYIISPLYYQDITDDLMNKYNKLNIWDNESTNGGFYLADLGNQWAGNYRNNRQVYGGDAVLYQRKVLEQISQNGKIKIDAPCDYAFEYVDVATSVPLASKMYAVYDETISFYQLVISGLFDYTTDYVNGMSNKSVQWYFSKVLETGSNVSFLLSAEDPAVLLETDYTQYYQSYYNNWKDVIVDFNTKINQLGIHQCTLTGFKKVNGLSEVTYTNKVNGSNLVLIVNSTDSSKTYNGAEIPAYSYIEVK